MVTVIVGTVVALIATLLSWILYWKPSRVIKSSKQSMTVSTSQVSTLQVETAPLADTQEEEIEVNQTHKASEGEAVCDGPSSEPSASAPSCPLPQESETPAADNPLPPTAQNVEDSESCSNSDSSYLLVNASGESMNVISFCEAAETSVHNSETNMCSTDAGAQAECNSRAMEPQADKTNDSLKFDTTTAFCADASTEETLPTSGASFFSDPIMEDGPPPSRCDNDKARCCTGDQHDNKPNDDNKLIDNDDNKPIDDDDGDDKDEQKLQQQTRRHIRRRALRRARETFKCPSKVTPKNVEGDWEDESEDANDDHDNDDSQQQFAPNLEKAENLKAHGNEQFRAGRYSEALQTYTEALLYCSIDQDTQIVPLLLSNRAACHTSLKDYESAVSDSTDAIELDNGYAKAYLRRFRAYEALNKWHDALSDIQKAIELDPGLRSKYESDRIRVERLSQEQFEREKKEMMEKLKSFGNWALGKVGLSLDNFKVEQNPQDGRLRRPGASGGSKMPLDRSKVLSVAHQKQAGVFIPPQTVKTLAEPLESTVFIPAAPTPQLPLDVLPKTVPLTKPTLTLEELQRANQHNLSLLRAQHTRKQQQFGVKAESDFVQNQAPTLQVERVLDERYKNVTCTLLKKYALKEVPQDNVANGATSTPPQLVSVYRIYSAPEILLYTDLLSSQECASLKRLFSATHISNFQSGIPSFSIKNYSFPSHIFLPEDTIKSQPSLGAVVNRFRTITGMTNTTTTTVELMVERLPGVDQYASRRKRHDDADIRDDMRKIQRFWDREDETAFLILFLNGEGGQLDFYNLGFAAQPKEGSALLLQRGTLSKKNDTAAELGGDVSETDPLDWHDLHGSPQGARLTLYCKFKHHVPSLQSFEAKKGGFVTSSETLS